ncbi:MAG TPA: endolytic transglycosylase MltG [Gammaproteobacteria bacterium]|nr:endolytic transglycosylase MltG [Gammaproteobacteria bacterium]
MKNRITHIILMSTGLMLLISVLFILYEYHRFTHYTIKHQQVVPQTFIITPGSSLYQVSHQLSLRQYHPFPPYYLYFYGRYQQQAHLIKAGEYTLPEETTLPELFALFVAGRVKQHSFTIIEGTTSQQLLTKIANDKRFKHVLPSSQLAEVMPLLTDKASHGEGEFAADTYYFPLNTTDKAFLQRAYHRQYAILMSEWPNRAKDLPYKTPYEALIMASIIEKETGIAEERPEISGVFVRRLKKGMRLQTDPTVIYGMGERYQGNIRSRDLTRDTPYNTYTRYGLPPSPIAIPSQEAIYAALHPAKGKSLYFVATGKEGRHAFSNTLIEHNRAVRRYQLKK